MSNNNDKHSFAQKLGNGIYNFFFLAWHKYVIGKIIIEMLIALSVLGLLYLGARFFFPSVPYASEDLVDLSAYQLRQMIYGFDTRYARLGLLCTLLFASLLLVFVWLHYLYSKEKHRAADLEKELEKQKEKADDRYDSLHKAYESAINKRQELEERIKDLQNQLYNAE